ncbi:MAG TPA: CDP-alcohol phosphatidyltransferase family protein [Bacteroidales bacterium]|nr:CDP-alcohol phosphatidyltransferase family protein [Bacteroidales bacterium]
MRWVNEYKKSLKLLEVEEILDVYFYRPLAFLVVKLVYPTRITPNQLTFAAISAGVTAGFFYASGTRKGSIIGALFFLLFNILDCSDGQLARLKKNGTPEGRIIDGIADYISEFAVFAGIAIGFHKSSDQPHFLIILLVLSGMSIMVQNIMVDYYRTRFLDYVQGRTKTLKEGIDEYEKEYALLKNQKGSLMKKLIISLYLKYSALQSWFTMKRRSKEKIFSSPAEYYRKNRIIIRFWVLIGPTAQITAIIICSFFCRFDIFFWLILAGFNSLALVLRIIQKRIDRSLIASH